jgi:outer membrane protein TolC
LADLRQAKARLDSAFADWTAAQNDLKGSIHTFNETTDLRARINKDQSDMQTYTSEIVGDISFLQSQWSLLTSDEKDYVISVEKSLP